MCKLNWESSSHNFQACKSGSPVSTKDFVAGFCSDAGLFGIPAYQSCKQTFFPWTSVISRVLTSGRASCFVLGWSWRGFRHHHARRNGSPPCEVSLQHILHCTHPQRVGERWGNSKSILMIRLFPKKGTQKKWLSNTKFVDFGGFFFRARKCETRSHHYQVDIKFGDFQKTDLVAKNHSQCHRGLSGRLKASRNLTFVCLKQCILVVFTSTGRPGWWYHKLSHPWFCTIKNPWNMLKLWIASPIFWGKAEEIASRWAPSGSL